MGVHILRSLLYLYVVYQNCICVVEYIASTLIISRIMALAFEVCALFGQLMYVSNHSPE